MPQEKVEPAVSEKGLSNRIEELGEQRAELNQEIESLSTTNKKEEKELLLEISQRKQILDNDLENVNSLINTIDKELLFAKKHSIDAINKLLQSVRSINKKISDYVFFALVASVAGILTSFAFGLSLGFVGVFLLVIGACVSARFTLKHLESNFSSFEAFLDNVKQSLLKIDKLEENPVPVRTNFQPINDKASTLTSYSKQLRDKTTTFVDWTQTYYSLRNKRENLRLFASKIRNTLCALAISPNSKAMDYLDAFTSDYDSEEKWIMEAAEGLSESCHTNSKVLGLLFAEFVYPEKVTELWSRVKSDEELFKQLAEFLYTKFSGTTYPITVNCDLASGKILQDMPTFSLSVFEKKFHDFYEPFCQSKTNLISAIRAYGVIKETLEQELLQLVASSNEEQNFLSQMFDLVSAKLQLPNDIIALMYYDNIHDEKINVVWVTVKDPEKTDLLLQLVSFLIDHGVLELPTNYSRNELTIFLMRRLNFLEDYSLLEVKASIANALFEMENNKSLVLRSVEHYLKPLELQTSQEIFSYLPQDYPTLMPIIEEVAKKTGVEREFVELFYNCYMKKRVDGKSPFIIFKNSSKLIDLARLLVGSKRVELFGEEIEAEQSLVTILTSQDDLDLPTTQFLVNKYSMLMTYNRQLANFLYDEKLSGTGALSFEVLFKTMSKVVNEETYKQLLELMKHFVRADETTYKQYTFDKLVN